MKLSLVQKKQARKKENNNFSVCVFSDSTSFLSKIAKKIPTAMTAIASFFFVNISNTIKQWKCLQTTTDISAKKKTTTFLFVSSPIPPPSCPKLQKNISRNGRHCFFFVNILKINSGNVFKPHPIDVQWRSKQLFSMYLLQIGLLLVQNCHKPQWPPLLLLLSSNHTQKNPRQRMRNLSLCHIWIWLVRMYASRTHFEMAQIPCAISRCVRNLEMPAPMCDVKIAQRYLVMAQITTWRPT